MDKSCFLSLLVYFLLKQNALPGFYLREQDYQPHATILSHFLLLVVLHLTDSDILLTQTTAEEEKDTTATSPAATIINLKKGNISNVKFEMNIPEDTTHIYAYLGKTELQNAKIDLGESSYTLDKFTIAGSAAQYDRGTEPDSISPANHLKFDNIALEQSRTLPRHPDELNRIPLSMMIPN